MKITLEPTPNFVEHEGICCRVWAGTTERGSFVQAYVMCVGIDAAGAAEDHVELIELVPTPEDVKPSPNEVPVAVVRRGNRVRSRIRAKC